MTDTTERCSPSKRVLGFAIACFLLIPAIARLLGVDARAIENRELAALPDFAIADLFEPEQVAALTRYAIDHLPLRDRVVAARSRLVLQLFRDSPSRQVDVGSDGWFYLAATFRRGCRGGSDVAALAGNLRRLGDIIEESGRQFILAIAPDKNAIYPEHLGPLESLAQCAQARRARLRDELQQDPPPGYIDLWRVLSEAKGPNVLGALYSSTDTHWTSFGAAQVAREIIELAEPGLWSRRSLKRRTGVQQVGDLTKLMGLPFETLVARYEVSRPLVQTRKFRGRAAGLSGSITWTSERARSHTEKPAISPKRVFLLADSFGVLVAPMLAPYFQETVLAQWGFVREPSARANFFESLRQSDVIVVEVVEHRSYFALDDILNSGPRLLEGFMTELASSLASETRALDD